MTETTHDSKPATGPALPVLELRDVHKTFRSDVFKGPQKVITGLSCSFRAGVCTGLLGHNGAGKTTTIRLILGLIRPDKGEILTFGHKLGMADRRHIGYMPEINKLPTALTPEEVLTFQVKLFRKSELPAGGLKAMVNQKLEEVGLTPHRRKKVSQLSKGLGRRLGWAQATIHEPSLVILDEPFSGLDPLGRQSMHEWIMALKRKGTSILLCTHELTNTQTLCDDYFIMQKGHLVYSYDRTGGAAAGENPFEIIVSGMQESKIPEFMKRHSLVSPASLSREGFLLKIDIAGQTFAQKWLQALLADGFVVVRFAEDSERLINDLLKFFKGGDAT